MEGFYRKFTISILHLSCYYLFFVSLNSTDDRLTLVPQVSFPMFTEENSDEMSLQRILPLAELLKN